MPNRPHSPPSPVPTVILGAAGRDFHNFNTVYRDDPTTRLVAFTGAQIPGISGRTYPRSLAGPLYPGGIPIYPEDDLEAICRREGVRRVVFAYSDVTHETVMHLASRALACGADFLLLGPEATMIRASVPVIAVSAVRTGCGKSQVARWISGFLRQRGYRVAVIRHPMPYGDLEAQRVQRFATREDLAAAHCTVEEREEYEPHIATGALVFAGVDYAAIAERAAAEADLLVWDGGNNDFPFLRPDLHLVVSDALRPGHAARYHPGEAVLRMADAAIINKVDAANPAAIAQVEDEVRSLNPRATIVRAASPVRLDNPGAVAGRRVVVVEDGPTITHGGMPSGAGYAAATAAGATVIDPRPFAAAAMREVYARYAHIGPVLPAIGYGEEQLAALRETLDACPVDTVVAATPADLSALIPLRHPVVRARYDYADAGEPRLAGLVDAFLARLRLAPSHPA